MARGGRAAAVGGLRRTEEAGAERDFAVQNRTSRRPKPYFAVRITIFSRTPRRETRPRPQQQPSFFFAPPPDSTLTVPAESLPASCSLCAFFR